MTTFPPRENSKIASDRDQEIGSVGRGLSDTSALTTVGSTDTSALPIVGVPLVLQSF